MNPTHRSNRIFSERPHARRGPGSGSLRPGPVAAALASSLRAPFRGDIVRNNAIVLLGVDTGLRPDEIAQLPVEDVDLQAGVLTVRPETSKVGGMRRLPPTIKAGVLEYVVERRVNPSIHPALFINERGEPF